MKKIEEKINSISCLNSDGAKAVKDIIEEITGQKFRPLKPSRFKNGDILKFLPTNLEANAASPGSYAIFIDYEWSCNQWLADVRWLTEYSNGQMNGGYYASDFVNTGDTMLKSIMQKLSWLK